MKAVLHILISLILISCTGDMILILNDNSNSDKYLMKNIIGKWYWDTYNTIIFYENNTFLDSLYSYNTIDGYFLEAITNGEYSIVNGILKFKEFHHSYYKIGIPASSVFVGRGDYIIEIKNDTLLQTPTITFSCDSCINSGLYNRWIYQRWIIAYHNRINEDPLLFYEGLIEEYYEFYDSTNTFINGWKYLSVDSLTDRQLELGYFSFSDPELILNDSYVINVSFTHDGKMTWIDEDGLLILHR